MAILGTKKKAPAKKTAKKAVKKGASAAKTFAPIDASAILIRPLLSEKAMYQGAKNVYVFVVAKNATKPQIARAVATAYSVTPIAVNVMNKAGKPTSRRTKGKQGYQRDIRKAYVTLKEGDRLQLI